MTSVMPKPTATYSAVCGGCGVEMTVRLIRITNPTGAPDTYPSPCGNCSAPLTMVLQGISDGSERTMCLWLNPGGEVRAAERMPERRHKGETYWLPAAGSVMTGDESGAVLLLITKAGYHGERVYAPRTPADDFEVQAHVSGFTPDEDGLLLARFIVDVPRALAWVRRTREILAKEGAL